MDLSSVSMIFFQSFYFLNFELFKKIWNEPSVENPDLKWQCYPEKVENDRNPTQQLAMMVGMILDKNIWYPTQQLAMMTEHSWIT